MSSYQFKILFLCAFGVLNFVRKSFAADFKKQIFLGEHHFENYYGPLDPSFSFNVYKRKYIFADEDYYEKFFDQNIMENRRSIEEFFVYQYGQDSLCSDHVLNKNAAYIRYLNRLLAMSYLFEFLNETQVLSYRLNLDKNICSINWISEISKCSAQTTDMKNFVKRAKKYLEKFSLNDRLIAPNKSFEKKWKKTITGRPEDLSIVAARYQLFCQKNPKKCMRNFRAQWQKNIKEICLEGRGQFQNLCSEQDHYFGLSLVPAIKEVLKDSNVLVLVNQYGQGSSCFDRYADVFKVREFYPEWLEFIFPKIYENLKQGQKSRYTQGELFLPGALKEFDMKGLKDFLFSEVKKIPKPVAPIKTPIAKKEIPKPAPKPKPVKIVVKATPTPMPVATPKPLSPFEKGVSFIGKGNSFFDVDMQEMKSFFTFDEDSLSSLKGPLSQFQTRQVLRSLKDNNNYGSEKEPMRLTFLWYLISQDRHQGLFNLQFIIGKRFFVINDLEGKNLPIMVELINNSSGWNIKILNESIYQLYK